MEKEITALRKEIAALRGAIDRLTKRLAVLCAPASGADDAAEEASDEEEESSCSA